MLYNRDRPNTWNCSSVTNTNTVKGSSQFIACNCQALHFTPITSFKCYNNYLRQILLDMKIEACKDYVI